jgi:hypothetical protein
MAYDEGLAQRIREQLADEPGIIEKKMFGGLTFMAGGNMACGVIGNELMARVGPAGHDPALERPGARPMDFTGRPMKGFLIVAPEGIDSDEELAAWLAECLAFARSLQPK